MSAAKSTPGPWKFSRWDEFGDARFYVSQQDGAPYTPHYSDVATLIAETVSSERVAIQEANARLIAAAPCLLEALQSTETYLSDLLNATGIHGGRTDAQLKVVRAAIAKATQGEQG